jgi:predicted transcriptional regulator
MLDSVSRLKEPNITILSKKTGIKRNVVSDIVDVFDNLGIVKLTQDGRSTTIALTRRGKIWIKLHFQRYGELKEYIREMIEVGDISALRKQIKELEEAFNLESINYQPNTLNYEVLNDIKIECQLAYKKVSEGDIPKARVRLKKIEEFMVELNKATEEVKEVAKKLGFSEDEIARLEPVVLEEEETLPSGKKVYILRE